MGTEEDGLSWMFELDADLKGGMQFLDVLKSIDAGVKNLDGALKNNGAASVKAGEAHKKHGNEAKGLAGVLMHLRTAALEPLIKKFEQYAEFEFIRKGVDALIELPGEIIDKLKELGEEMVNVAAKAERTNKAFSLVFGAEVGGETLEYIEKIGKYTEFSREQLKGAALDLAKVGFKGEGLTRALAASMDISAFSKNGAEGQADAIGALERIKNTGQVNRRTLMPLGISEGDFFKELTKNTGKGRKELKKEMEAGTLDAETSLETLYTMITKRTHKDLGGAGVDMATTLDATLTHLRELPERYYEKLVGTAGFEKLKAQFGTWLEQLDPDSPNGKRIFSALEEAFSFVADLISKIDLAAVIEDATDAMEGFEFTLAAAMSLLPGETGKKGDDLLNNLAHRKLDRENEKRTGAGAAAKAVEDPGYADDMADLDNAAAAGLLGEKSKVYNAAVDVGDAAHAGVKDALKINSPSRVFMDLGSMSAQGFGIGLSKGMDEAYGDIPAPTARGGAPTPTAQPGARAAGAGGGVHVHFDAPIAVHAGERPGAELAEEIVSRLRDLVPHDLAALFEQVAAESGAEAPT